jgi:thiamine kinase-like enzyme
MRKTISREVDEIIGQIPNWTNAKDIQIEPLEGLTNVNYLVMVAGERFVIRVSGKNAVQLGINRELEAEALLAASNAGIGPQIVRFFLPEGHLVTRCINGHHWTLDEYRTRDNLRRLVETVKRLHALPLVEASFSPFRRVEAYANQTRSMKVPFPQDFDKLVHKMEVIKREQASDTYLWQRFCHNDLFWVNVLDDGNVRFIDWELAGVGDIYYDLATLLYAYDSADTLPRELQEYVLECYFGEVRAENWTRLDGMKFMLMFFSAMWGLLQYGLQRQGLVRIVDGFDFKEYAETTFDAVRAGLS